MVHTSGLRKLSRVATRMTHRLTNESSNGSFDLPTPELERSHWSDTFPLQNQISFPQCLRYKRKVKRNPILEWELIVYSRVANNTGSPSQK